MMQVPCPHPAPVSPASSGCVVCLVAATAATAAAVAVLSHEFVVIVMAQMCVHATATTTERVGGEIKDLWPKPFTNCLRHSCGCNSTATGGDN